MRVPGLRLHNRGVWFCRFAGRDHYFTRDRDESQRRYLELLDKAWMPYAASRRRAGAGPHGERLTLTEAAELYLSDVLGSLGKRRMGCYRGYLAALLNRWPALPLERLDAGILQAIKTDLIAEGKKPRTVNHAVKAIRRMYTFAADAVQLERRADLSRVKLVKVARPAPRAPELSEVVRLLRAASDPGHPSGEAFAPSKRYPTARRAADPRLLPWLALGYLACLRPSELVRLVHGQGQWAHAGVFEMASKVQKSDGENYRYVILSDEALGWLRVAEPAWRTWEGYSKAARDIVGRGGVRRLRAWGATHLRRAGAAREDIGLILGHERGEALRHYVGEDWRGLRRVAALLTLRPALQATSAPPAIPASEGDDDDAAWSPS